MTDHLPDLLAAIGADPEVYRAELDLASALAQVHGGDPRTCCDECKRVLGLLSTNPPPSATEIEEK